MMYIVVIAWMFVVTLMSVVEATASNGSVLGGIYGGKGVWRVHIHATGRPSTLEKEKSVLRRDRPVGV